MKLTIDNSFSKIEGLKTEQFRALRKLLSYESDPQSAYFSGGFRRVKYLIDAKGSFPTGLISQVIDYLDTLPAHTREVVDNRVKPRNLLAVGIWPGATPYPDQVQALRAALEHGRGTISMPTGSGKSLVIALIAHSIGLKTLVVVPNLEIKKQLKESLSALLNVTVENIDSKALKTGKGFDCLIIDEAHHVAAKTYQDLNKTAWRGIYYRFFLTATPFRNNSTETLLFEAIAGDLIYSLTYRQAIDRGYIVPVEAYYIDLPKVQVEGYTWSQVYSELVVNNKERNTLIAYTLLQLQHQDKSTLCLVKEVKHGEILSEMTGIPFLSGRDEDRSVLAEFNKGEIKALIGTTGVMGEGIDTKPAEYVIIAGLGKAKSAFMQQVGRGVRRYEGKDSCKVILFRDKSHKFTLRHYKEQAKILLDEYNIEPVKLEV